MNRRRPFPLAHDCTCIRRAHDLTNSRRKWLVAACEKNGETADRGEEEEEDEKKWKYKIGWMIHVIADGTRKWIEKL